MFCNVRQIRFRFWWQGRFWRLSCSICTASHMFRWTFIRSAHLGFIVTSATLVTFKWYCIDYGCLRAIGSNKSSTEDRRLSPIFHRVSFCATIRAYSSGSSRDSAASVRNPLSTQRKRPPAQYWVNETLLSPFCTGMFECATVADGMRIVAPWGNSMMSFASQSMRCPPSFGLKLPRACTAHQPKGQFRESRCLNVQTFPPKLKVAQLKILLSKFFLRSGRCEWSLSRCSW